MNDLFYMKTALELAQKGCGLVNLNPLVGAVIVKDGEMIGKGYHAKYGQPHAERNALADCTASPAGATLYVTLEPCCHYGKTPPCTEAILKSGIARVVIGSQDPNPLVAGKGVAILRQNGIKVTEGVLKDACDKLNEVFFHFIKTKTPFVVMKYAMTMDGKIATRGGKSQWITGEEARRHVHASRQRYSAIMVGVGTVMADDPLLTCRIEGGRNPMRIICDTNLRTPLTSRIIKTAKDVNTYLATACSEPQKQQPFIDAGCTILCLPKKEDHIDLNKLLRRLGEANIDSVLLEGGATLNDAALQSGIVNKVQAYIAPKIFGGEDAKSPVGGLGVAVPDGSFLLAKPEITVLGHDILIESEVIKNVHGNR